mmetsp:Transcript_10920/g.12604  ORF Transcript_10920/g.12604 Transcript_10920/m.12604 type:complete len:155 (-) Transcript_10920:144-608(-)
MAKSSVSLVGAEDGISGLLQIEQENETSPTIITGEVTGLTPGKHAIAVLVFGDLSNPPASLGPHFNPHGKNHGFPDAEERHVGSLGNIEADAEGKAVIKIEDKLVKLIGPQSVIGRSIAIMANEDDGGLSGHEQSLLTGNAGAPVAYGVIGIKA